MIVIIDNYDSFTFNLYQAVAMRERDVQVFRNDKITIDELKKMPISGLIISPGPGRPQQAGISIDVITACADDFPILGICLGHQAMCCAYGGEVDLAGEPVHGKQTTVFYKEGGLYDKMPQPFKAGRYHSLVVQKQTLPDCFVIDAENEEGIIMGMHHRDKPMYGMQFHPESILTPHGQQLIDNFIGKTHAH